MLPEMFSKTEQIAFALNWFSLRDKGWDGPPAMKICVFSALESRDYQQHAHVLTQQNAAFHCSLHSKTMKEPS